MIGKSGAERESANKIIFKAVCNFGNSFAWIDLKYACGIKKILMCLKKISKDCISKGEKEI